MRMPWSEPQLDAALARVTLALLVSTRIVAMPSRACACEVKVSRSRSLSCATAWALAGARDEAVGLLPQAANRHAETKIRIDRDGVIIAA